MKRTTKTALIFILPALLAVWGPESLLFIYAVFYVFYHYVLTKVFLGVYFNGLDNFRRLVFDPKFFHSMRITGIYVVFSLILETFAGLGIALLLNKEIRGKIIFRSLLILPMVTAPTVVAFIWKILLHPTLGVLNYLLSLIGIAPHDWLGNPSIALYTVVFIEFWQWTPFMALVLLAGLEALPPDPFEMAKTEGAGRWLVFRRITLPMLGPVFVIAVLIRMIWLFKYFDVIYTLTRGGPGVATNVVGMEIYRVAFREWNIGYGLTLGWIQLLIVLAIVEIFLYYCRDLFIRR